VVVRVWLRGEFGVEWSTVWGPFSAQAEYIGVDVEGPYKPEHYRY